MQQGTQRHQIREQLGVLEEKLEELGALAGANERHSLRTPGPVQFGSDLLLQEALDSMRMLGQLVHEQQLFKSISANDFLQRILSQLVQDAAAQGCDIAVCHYGEGKISMEMAELVMGAIVAGFRASLRSHKGLQRAGRVKKHLFPTGSIYVEVRATPGEIQFRLVDDGQGYSAHSSDLAIGTEKQFEKLREHIALCGGWFGRSSFGEYGGLIEFKAPLAHNRVKTLILQQGDFEALVPSSCVAEVIERGSSAHVPEDALIFQLDEAEGVVPGNREAGMLLRLGVADLQFWLSCDGVKGEAFVRRVSASEFVEAGSWMQNLGLYAEEGGGGRALPLLEGSTLIRFHKDHSGGSS